MPPIPDQPVVLRPPTVDDGKTIWRLARDSATSDPGPASFYLLWCHDFATTSLVATVGGRLVGYLLGYRRQDHPDTLVVWQEEINPSYRGRGLRRRMLSEVMDRNVARGVSFVETTDSSEGQRVGGRQAPGRRIG